jgi:hypothetical protein
MKAFPRACRSSSPRCCAVNRSEYRPRGKWKSRWFFGPMAHQATVSVFGDVDALARLERHRDELARVVVGEGDAPWACRLHHHQRHPGLAPVPALLHRSRGKLRGRVGPQQDVMGEVDLVTRSEVHLDYRHVAAGDLALGPAGLDAGQVADRRLLHPSLVVADLAHVDGRPAARAGRAARVGAQPAVPADVAGGDACARILGHRRAPISADGPVDVHRLDPDPSRAGQLGQARVPESRAGRHRDAVDRDR